MARRPRRRRDYHTRLYVQQLQQSSTTPTARGHATRAWTTIATVWGHKAMLSGREGQLMREIQPTATHEVETDASTDITDQRRFVVADSTGQILNIEAVDDLEGRGRTMRVLCSERVKTT